MTLTNDIFSDEWVDQIFDEHHRSYGAYQLRKKSAGWHFRALVIAVILFVLVSLIPAIIRQISPDEREKHVSVRTMSDINLEKPPPPPNEDVLKEIPPPPPL